MFSKHEEAIDVSRGGVRVYSDAAMSVGERLVLDLFLAGGREVSFRAEVVWVEALAPDAPAKYDVGLKFLTLDADAEKLLDTVLGEQ
jgi:hypothetical protein